MNTLDQRLVHGGLVAASAVALLLSWQQGVRPSADAYARDRARVVSLTAQIADAQRMVQAGGGVETWLASHQQRLQQLQGRLSDQTQLPQLLNALSATLQAAEVTVVNVTQGNLEPAQASGQALLFDGRPCERLPVTVTVEGRYHAVLAAMDQLMGETFPGVVSVAEAELRLKEAGGVRLQAVFKLYLYVCQPLPASPSANA